MTKSSGTKHSPALWLAVTVLLLIASGMAWLVQSGVRKSETFLPAKMASHQRTVYREQEPALFWTSIGIYAVIGTGTLGLAAWMLRVTFFKRIDNRTP